MGLVIVGTVGFFHLKPVELSALQEVTLMFKDGGGSGVLIEGGIITVSHIVRYRREIKLVNNGKEIVGKVVKIDKGMDLAFIRVEGKYKYTKLRLNPQLGEQIYVVGAPGDIEDAITFGRVARITEDSLVIDARISMGSSGGGVFDRKGRLLGIVQQIWGHENWPGEYMNLAIPAKTIKEFLEE